MYVEYPVETISSYTTVKGERVQTEQVIYRPRKIEMLNARYGRIKTDEKALHEYPYKPGYNTETVKGIKIGYGYGVDTEREEFLYDVIDTATGYVLTRTFRGDCRAFINLIIDMGFYFCGEEKRDIDVLSGPNQYNKRWRKEHRLVGVYASGKKEIHSYRKLVVKED